MCPSTPGTLGKQGGDNLLSAMGRRVDTLPAPHDITIHRYAGNTHLASKSLFRRSEGRPSPVGGLARLGLGILGVARFHLRNGFLSLMG